MKIRKIKENQLRSIIKECVKHVLNEGYSAKAHQNEIVAIAKEAYEAIIVNGQGSYTTKWEIPLGDGYVNTHEIYISVGRKEDAYVNRSRLTVLITRETTPNTIAKLLMHEITHIYDEIGYKKTGFNDKDMYRNISSVSSEMPKGIKDIIYHLWIPTEFNAFQTTYDFQDENFDAMLERFMGCLQELYNLPTTHGIGWQDNYEGMWNSVRYALRGHIPDRYQNCTADKFKKYFITHSMDLLKKLVRKWNGQQNTNFV